MADVFDPYYEWLGIAPSEQPPNRYRLLGIGLFEANEGVIANAADRQMGHLRGFAAGKYSKLSAKLLNEVAAARVCLLNAAKKAAYDEQLRQELAASGGGLSTAAPIPIPVNAMARPLPADPGGPIHGLHGAPCATDPQKPSAVLLAVGGAAALLVLGVLVWWLAGAGSSSPSAPHEFSLAEPDGPPPDAPAEDSRNDAEAPVSSMESEPPTLPEAPEAAVTGGDPAEAPPANGLDGSEPPDPIPSEAPPAVDPDEQFSLPPPEEPAEPASPAQPPESEPPRAHSTARRAVPDRMEQEALRRILDETYDTVASRTAEERLRLAGQLAGLAEKAADPTERFVLLRRASELASEGGDPRGMLQQVDRIADEFEVDRLLAQAHMLDAFSKRANSEEQIGALVGASATVIDAAVSAERFELADTLSAAVYRACQPAAGRAFRAEALSRRRKVQEQRDRWNDFQAAVAELKSNPDDAEANTIAGQWYCLVQGDWDRAMPHFAKGSNPELRALAGRELAEPPRDAHARVDLADAWWSLAENSATQSEPFWLTRAAYWYKLALPELASGLVQAKVSKRLEELRKRNQSGPQADNAPPAAVAPFDARQAALHQQAWSKYLKTPALHTNSVQMRLVLIPPGEFSLGSAEEELAKLVLDGRWPRPSPGDIERLEAETPARRVSITRPFFMGAYPVTQGEYERVTGVVSNRFRRDPNRPIDSVSWYEAAEFCRMLSSLPAEKAAGRGYRLPTEAEWEYACRAGTATWFSFGDDPAGLGQYAWWNGNSQRRAQPVARLKPNPWGLFDMHGNINEWCSDWFEAGYGELPGPDPQGPATGSERVVRGGSYNDGLRECRSAFRAGESPDNRSYRIGFRVVLVPASELPDQHTQEPEPSRPEGGSFDHLDRLRREPASEP